MNFRQKILFVSVIPLTMILLLSAILLSFLPARLAKSQSTQYIDYIVGIKTQELNSALNLAVAAIKPTLERLDVDENARQEIATTLTNLEFGEDGYFFVYDFNGVNIAHPRQPFRVGQSWLELQDPNGQFVIRDLIERARNGGGDYNYMWEKPSSGKLAEKLSMVIPIEPLNWMLGTGLYLDDVHAQAEILSNKVEQSIQNSLFTVATITLLILILTSLIIVSFNVQQFKLADNKVRDLNARLVKAQEAERIRISRDLHDGVGQLVASARFELDHATKSLKNDSNEQALTKHLEPVRNLLVRIIKSVRQASHDLRPPSLDELGLEAAIEARLNEFSSHTGIQTSFDGPSSSNMSKDTETALFRVFQEAIANILKHAKATKVDVRLIKKSNKYWLEVKDDGVGGVSIIRDQSSGIGLTNMVERLNALGGTLSISEQSPGTKLLAIAPSYS